MRDGGEFGPQIQEVTINSRKLGIKINSRVSINSRNLGPKIFSPPHLTKPQFEFVPRDTEEYEFLDLVDFEGVANSVETIVF